MLHHPCFQQTIRKETALQHSALWWEKLENGAGCSWEEAIKATVRDIIVQWCGCQVIPLPWWNSSWLSRIVLPEITAVTSTTASVMGCIVEKSVPHLRSTNGTDDYNEMSSSGIFPPNCIFCRSKRKRKKDWTVELLGACETLEAAKNIQDAAEVLQDKDIISKVIGVDLVAKEAKYHHTCKSTFLLRADRTSRTGAGASIIQQKGAIALKTIYDYTEKSVIVDKRAEMLTSLYDR